MHVLFHIVIWAILIFLMKFTYSRFKSKKFVQGILMSLVCLFAFAVYGAIKRMGL